VYLDHIMARTVVQAVVKANSKSNGNGKIYICDRLLTDVNVITGVTVHKFFMDKMLIFAVLQWWLLRLRETNSIFMVALCNRADRYILPCGFYLLSSFFSSPNLSGRRLDVYHTSTHGVALVRI